MYPDIFHAPWSRLARVTWAIAFGILGFVTNLEQLPSPHQNQPEIRTYMFGHNKVPAKPGSGQMRAYVTGYNTVPSQTGSHPCVSASGANICGRQDVVACPRQFPFGTVVDIRGRPYICEDRTAAKFGSRFDISCDKDESCPYEVSGWALVNIRAASHPQMLVALGTADLF